MGTKELVVHHLYKVSVEELAKECLGRYATQKQLFWCDGVLFLFEQVAPIMGDEIVADFMKGKEHWQEAYYADTPTYTEYIELDEGDFRGAKVRVVKADAFSPHKEFAAWVKKH